MIIDRLDMQSAVIVVIEESKLVPSSCRDRLCRRRDGLSQLAAHRQGFAADDEPCRPAVGYMPADSIAKANDIRPRSPLTPACCLDTALQATAPRNSKVRVCWTRAT